MRLPSPSPRNLFFHGSCPSPFDENKKTLIPAICKDKRLKIKACGTTLLAADFSGPSARMPTHSLLCNASTRRRLLRPGRFTPPSAVHLPGPLSALFQQQGSLCVRFRFYLRLIGLIALNSISPDLSRVFEKFFNVKAKKNRAQPKLRPVQSVG